MGYQPHFSARTPSYLCWFLSKGRAWCGVSKYGTCGGSLPRGVHPTPVANAPGQSWWCAEVAVRGSSFKSDCSCNCHKWGTIVMNQFKKSCTSSSYVVVWYA